MIDAMYGPESSVGEVAEGIGWAPGYAEERTGMLGFYIWHNIGIAFRTFAMGITFGILISTFMSSGAEMTGEAPTTLPEGVIALVGWANRFLIVVYCAWIMLVAWPGIKTRS